MLKKIKTLLNITDDSQDNLLNLLIALCSDEAMAYCNLNHSIPELETPIIYMVVERYNKIGSEGLDNINTNGITENYIINYSDNILNKLKRYRKMKVI